LLPGSNLETSTEAVRQASGLLKARYPEVIKVVGKIGSGEIPTDPMPIEAADLMIILKDPSEWTSPKQGMNLPTKWAKPWRQSLALPLVFNTRWPCGSMNL
ncbi:MAG: hypothetical protein ACKODJ_09640, partial [Bacteroidota bacterium]